MWILTCNVTWPFNDKDIINRHVSFAAEAPSYCKSYLIMTHAFNGDLRMMPFVTLAIFPPPYWFSVKWWIKQKYLQFLNVGSQHVVVEVQASCGRLELLQRGSQCCFISK